MLESLDIVIGFSAVMLIFSLAATAIIQALISVLQLRGWHLWGGIVSLLRQIDPKIEKRVANDIAWAVVRHPFLARAPMQIASIVQREELVQLLLQLADDEDWKRRAPEAQKRLQVLLSQHGIPNPAGLLRDIHVTAMNLELDRPDMAAHLRQAAAVIGEAKSLFVAKVNNWFDSTMDRVSLVFSMNARLLTIVVALLMAFTLRLDAIHLVNQLSVSKEAREALLTMAIQAEQMPAPSDAGSTTLGRSIRDLQGLVAAKLIEIPADPRALFRKATMPNSQQLLGILLSVVMIGLGAPFWFNTLRRLLSLRSTLAAKDDSQRSERAKSPARASDRAGTATAGEQGDLSPVG